MLDIFLDQGGNFLDTAKIYSDWIPGETSRSEKLLGKWMTERKNRGQVVLATKGAHPELASMHIPRCSPGEIAADLEESLRHLNTEPIDMYWLHRDDPARPAGEILEALQAHVRAGKIRAYGGSNWSLERIKEAQNYAKENHLDGFTGIQNFWNLAQLNPGAFTDNSLVFMDDLLLEYHQTTGLPAVPYTSQANGVYQKLAACGSDQLPEHLKKWYLNPITSQRYERLHVLMRLTGLSTTQIVLGYLLTHPFPVLPIIGPKSPDQLSDCLTAGDITIDIHDSFSFTETTGPR
jgi:aryl-alcohol dehydrogenase-like predicted oxidoreductase